MKFHTIKFNKNAPSMQAVIYRIQISVTETVCYFHCMKIPIMKYRKSVADAESSRITTLCSMSNECKIITMVH